MGGFLNCSEYEVIYKKRAYHVVNYKCKKNEMSISKINRVHRDESNLYFVIRFPEGKTIDDIEDVKFLVKEKEETLLADSLISKSQLDNEIALSGLDVAMVTIDVDDYDDIVIGNLYKASLFCKWIGDTDFDENVEYLFDFQTKQNFDNNN
jgi:hypothetical protein